MRFGNKHDGCRGEPVALVARCLNYIYNRRIEAVGHDQTADDAAISISVLDT